MDLDLDFDFVPFADIPSGLDGGGNVNKVGKYQPRVKVNAESKRKLPVSCGASIGRGEGSISDAFNAENPEEEFVHPSLSSTGDPTLAPKNTSHEHVSQETLNNGETGLSDYDQVFLTNAAESEREEQALPNDIPQTTTLSHKLFDLLIEKLPQAEEGQNSDEDMESFGVAAEAEAEDDVETYENAENMKDAEVDSPAKSVHETEDEMESDFGGYEPY